MALCRVKLAVNYSQIRVLSLTFWERKKKFERKTPVASLDSGELDEKFAQFHATCYDGTFELAV